MNTQKNYVLVFLMILANLLFAPLGRDTTWNCEPKAFCFRCLQNQLTVMANTKNTRREGRWDGFESLLIAIKRVMTIAQNLQSKKYLQKLGEHMFLVLCCLIFTKSFR